MTSSTEPIQATLPIVAIVGRPNVGKSALFNRLVGGRPALVEDLPGTTRDRLYGIVDWPRRPFRVVDTGGLEEGEPGTYPPLIRAQIERAITEASVVIFVVDTRDGITAADVEVATMLRRSKRPVVLAANKSDSAPRRDRLAQFYELGMGDPLAISAYHDMGIAELLDAVAPHLPEVQPPATDDDLRIAIIGRPNVGKSALLNAVLGEQRVIVSDVPGTTRDAIDTEFSFGGRALTLIDTAGIRRRGHIDPGVERHSVMRADDAIERADVALAVMDAGEMLTAQDMHIIQKVEESFRSLVIVINKIDLIGDSGPWRDDLTRLIRHRLKFAPWASICFVSALQRRGIDEMLQAAVHSGDARKQRVTTPELNMLVKRSVTRHPPPSSGGRRLHILYATQPGVRPPTFVFFVNDSELVHFSYERYLENKIREAFGFQGTPMKLLFKKRGNAQ